MQIKKFLDSIKGLSDNTRHSYKQTLGQLESAIKGTEPTQKDILKFLKHYHGSSLNRHKVAIKAYLKFKGEPWLFTPEQFSPAEKIVPPYVPPHIVGKIIETADSEDDRMFIYTLFTLGCTIDELISIESKYISKSWVTMHIKVGTVRLRPITKEFYKKIAKYARNKEAKIFPRPYSYYYARLRLLAKQAGFNEVAPIMIRNARAVDLFSKGMALPVVQKFFGDASINRLAILLRSTSDRLNKEELIDELEKAESI